MRNVAVIIPWRWDTERRLTLPFVVDHLVSALQPARLVLADDPDPSSFNRGRALNAGAQGLSERVLVFADADLLIDPEVLRKTVELAQQEEYVCYVPFHRVSYLTCQATAHLISSQWKNWHEQPWKPKDVESEWNHPSLGGINILSRVGFEESGGFDPRMRGWGFEDSAFGMAFATLVGPVERIDSHAIHLWHPTSNGKQPALQQANRKLCERYEQAAKNPDEMRALIREHYPHFQQ